MACFTTPLLFDALAGEGNRQNFWMKLNPQTLQRGPNMAQLMLNG